MARPQHLYVFCYDVTSNAMRRKLADMLEDDLVRVQKSVFEGRMTSDSAKKLASRSRNYLEEGDSLRVYCITEDARQQSLTIGGTPFPEAADFWLL